MTASNTADDESEESADPADKHPIAEVHLAARSGGHWWNRFDQAEPRDSYQWADEAVRGLEAVPEEHRPDVPETVVWTEYVAYKCRRPECQDDCLNRMDSKYAQTKLCRACFPSVDLDTLDPLTHHLPSERRVCPSDIPE